MTPEQQREWESDEAQPSTFPSPDVRPVSGARVARYAEAIMGGKERAALLTVRNPGEVSNAYRDARAVVAVADAERAELDAEVERLHSWQGLLELLDEHWPEDIFPTKADDGTRDTGPRLVSALRRADAAEAKLRDVEALLDRVEREQAAGDEWDVDEVVHDVRLAVLAWSQAPQAPAEQEGAHDAAGCDAWSCPVHGEANRDAAETRWFAKQIAEQEGIAAMARDFSRWLNGTYPADVSEEAVHWRRVLKVCEEAGEVRAALGAYLHENPRKPAGSLDDVISELADCVGAALGAIEHLTGHEGRSLDIATERVRYVCERVGVRPAPSARPATAEEPSAPTPPEAKGPGMDDEGVRRG